MEVWKRCHMNCLLRHGVQPDEVAPDDVRTTCVKECKGFTPPKGQKSDRDPDYRFKDFEEDRNHWRANDRRLRINKILSR